MRQSRLFILILLVAASSHAQTPLRELRGVWVTDVASQVLFAKPTIAAMMDSLKRAGINAIFPAMFNNGYTHFPSLTMLSVAGEQIAPKFRGRDVLAELIAEAHRVGIEVHPWLEYGFAASFGNNGGPILQNNPNWAGKRLSTGNAQDDEATGGGFYWMSQAHPDVRDFLIGLAVEIVDNYDVDGIQLDRVRYGRVHFGRNPNNAIQPSDFGYDDAHMQRYRAENNGANPPNDPNEANWRKFRAKILNEFNAALYDSLKAHNRNIIVSNAPIVYPYGYEYFMQDWPLGLKSGKPDFIATQLYRQDLGSYVNELANALNLVPSGYRGLYPGMLIRVNSYQASASLATGFIQQNRTRNVQGGIFFFYEGIPAIASALRQQVFQQPAIPPYRDKLWRPEAVIVQENAATVERIGNWTSVTGAGDASFFSFDNALLTARGSSNAVLRYSANVPVAANYDIYIYQPFGASLGKTVTAKLLDASNKQIVVDQTNSISRGWILVGTSLLNAGLQKILELNTAGVPATQTVAADGVMLILNRKLSPNVVVTAVEEKSNVSVPKTSALLQNYPNPFNPATNIEFDLHRAQLIQLAIFDLQSRRVAVLAEGKYAAGNHRAIFDASQLPAGVYFYRLAGESFVVTRKLVLIK